jgi:valyl-tRNA synthetase
MMISKEDVKVCTKCGSNNIVQEEDVLDTWFSSALWPFSTLGYPEMTEDLKYFYPTDVLVTGYDIIFFWVARMIFSGLEHMGKEPFSTVFIHGLVRDAQGRKMSKSLGNGIDPLEIIEKYGADALRYALATGNSPGNDMRFSDEKIEAARNFANKLWNASRFVRMNLTIDEIKLPEADKLASEDKWILNEFNKLTASVTESLDKYEVGIALSEIYDFTWDVFCDWYIELCKARLNDKDNEGNAVAQNVLAFVLTGILKLLHPFMPFITEEIYQALPHTDESIMISEYPSFNSEFVFESDAEKMNRVITAIKAIRARRNEMNVPPSRKAKVYIATRYTDSFNDSVAVFFTRLASASEVEIGESFDDVLSADDAVRIVTDSATVFLPIADIVDTEKERARLEAEQKKLLGEIERIEKKLSNEGFVAKAPTAVVDGEKAKLAKYRENLDGVVVALKKLG